MRKYIFTTIVLIYACYSVYGQITTNEEPVSFRANVSNLRISERSNKILPSLDMNKIKKEDIDDESNGVPPRFGYPHEVNYNMDNSGEWADLQDGGRIWRLSISCPDALSINLLYDKFWIPEGAKFFIYSNDHKHSIGAFTSANNNGERNDLQGFATGLVYSDQITLEYYCPQEVKENGVISIAYAVHGYRYILMDDEYEKAGYGQSGNCNININCTQGANWQNEKKAVAMILVNGIRLCTGSLVNTTANDNRPLFLTANHCLGGYDAVSNNSPNLNWWSFYWNYESPTCANAVPPILSTSGAKLVANNSISDFALLDLSGSNSDPRFRADITTYYLGWDCSGSPGVGGVGIHHPEGDIMKISVYSITPTSTDYLSNTVNASENYWRITWSAGTTEGVSSGSPLLNNNKRIIGQLKGGLASCSYINDPDWYGKFSVSWTGNGASDYRRRLNYWLDPLGTNPTTHNGVPLYLPTISISGPTSVTAGSGNQYYAYPYNYSIPAITSYEWVVSPSYNTQLYDYGSWVSIYFNDVNTYRVSCRATNSIGKTGQWADLYVDAHYHSPSPAYPNPVDNILNVDVGSTAGEKGQNLTYDLRLYSATGNMMRQISNSGCGTVQIDVSNLPDGIYFLHIYDGINGVPEVQQIIVKH